MKHAIAAIIGTAVLSAASCAEAGLFDCHKGSRCNECETTCAAPMATCAAPMATCAAPMATCAAPVAVECGCHAVATACCGMAAGCCGAGQLGMMYGVSHLAGPGGPTGYEGLPNMDGHGVHGRYPYHSYRRPWFHPGPKSANVSIVW